MDISNYGGELTPEECAGMLAAGVQHVIVRVSLEDYQKGELTRQQLAACRAAGIPYSGYVFPDYDSDPREFLLRVFALSGCLRSLWIDIEPSRWQPLPHPDVIERWVRGAKAACPPDLLVGIYTAQWCWPAGLDLSDLTLWFASYGGDITLDVAFGGWSRAAGIQHVGTTELAGQSCDLSLFQAGILG